MTVATPRRRSTRRRDQPTRATNPAAGYVVVLDEPHATSVQDADRQQLAWPPDQPLAVMAITGDGGLCRLRRQARHD